MVLNLSKPPEDLLSTDPTLALDTMQLHSMSPAINLVPPNFRSHLSTLEIVIVGAGATPNILTTSCGNLTSVIAYHVVEPNIFALARDAFFSHLACDTALGLSDRVQAFLGLERNSCLHVGDQVSANSIPSYYVRI